MAYRPSPIEFPAMLAAVPPQARMGTRPINGVVLLFVTFAALLVSAAYAAEQVRDDAVGEIWKPGLGALGGLIVGALAVWSIARRPTFVRRGDWIAVYEGGRQTKVMGTGELQIISLSTLRTVKLCVASFVVTLIGLIGVPAYVHSGAESFVIVAWLLSALIVGVAIAFDCVAGRIASVTVRLDGVDHTLARLP